MTQCLLSTFAERTVSDGQLHALMPRYSIAMVRHVNAIANRSSEKGYPDITIGRCYPMRAMHRAAVLLIPVSINSNTSIIS